MRVEPMIWNIVEKAIRKSVIAWVDVNGDDLAVLFWTSLWLQQLISKMFSVIRAVA